MAHYPRGLGQNNFRFIIFRDRVYNQGQYETKHILAITRFNAILDTIKRPPQKTLYCTKSYLQKIRQLAVDTSTENYLVGFKMIARNKQTGTKLKMLLN